MKYGMNHLSLAVRLALTAGVFATAGVAQAQAPQTDNPTSTDQATPPSKSKAKNLEAVVVTGSLIRRVDVETASPVVTLDRATISNSGKPVLGDVLQQMPSISGNATNPQNNSNGGGVASPLLEAGDGASRVSLRGLGISRTLVLVNGQRMANPDINLIPPEMIEKVDVLAEGASTVYGSDAIGGVVNFILRKDFKGAQFSLNDGISSHGDAQRRGFNLTGGMTGEHYSIAAGLDYNKYDATLAARRKFSKQQLYLSSGSVVAAGSSSIPTGRIQVPASIASQYGCTLNSSGYAQVTLATGDGSSLGDYRCRLGSDTFNYAALNYIQTAQKRTNGFVLGSYDFTDNLTGFVDAFYNHTVSSGQDAPSPVGTGDGLIISSSNPINPFGITFSQNPVPGDPNSGYNFQTRLTGAGTRVHSYTTDTSQINTGLRGNFGQESSWTWDASINYSHTKRDQRDTNEVDIPALQAAVDGGANIFDQANAGNVLSAGVKTPIYIYTQSTKQAQFDASGELWDLPAGAVQLSAGALYRKQFMNYTVSDFAVLDPTTTTCQILQEACGSPGRGSFNVKEVYAETLIPLVRGRNAMDIPGCWSVMRHGIRNLGRPGICSMAMAAVDVALWDLKAKLLGVPLVTLLGAAQPGVPVYGSGGFTSYSIPQLQAQLAGWVASGMAAVKMKIGRDPGHDLERVAAARAHSTDVSTRVEGARNGRITRTGSEWSGGCGAGATR